MKNKLFLADAMGISVYGVELYKSCDPTTRVCATKKNHFMGTTNGYDMSTFPVISCHLKGTFVWGQIFVPTIFLPPQLGEILTFDPVVSDFKSIWPIHIYIYIYIYIGYTSVIC